MQRPRFTAAVTVSCGALLMIVGCFLPWLRSGERERSSFELFGLVDRLGFASSGAFAWAVRLWPMVPLLAIVASIGVWYLSGLRIVAPALVATIYAGGVSIGMQQIPNSAFVGVGTGPLVTATGCVVMLVATIAAARMDRQARIRRRAIAHDAATRLSAPSAGP
jgi:hypothetical protein